MSFEVTILDNRAEFLRARGENITSQFGEDGYTKALFNKIGAVNRWCFEVGAHDGLLYSNTKWMRDAGWNAMLIEADQEQAEKLTSLASATVQTVWRRVVPAGIDSLDCLLRDADLEIPTDLDFGVIDIDGQDYFVWEGMYVYKPRVLLVEFNYSNDNEMPVFWGTGQAGLNPILELGRRKGYAPLLRTYCNVLFCRSDVWEVANG